MVFLQLAHFLSFVKTLKYLLPFVVPFVQNPHLISLAHAWEQALHPTMKLLLYFCGELPAPLVFL